MEAVVLVTGAGAPGIKGTLFSLRNNFDKRKIRTVGVDIREDVVGRHLCDSFHVIPKPSEQSFLSRLMDVCEKEKVDVILPQVTAELAKLSEHRRDFEKTGTKVAISDRKGIEISNNKHELMKISRKLGLPTANFYLSDNFSELEKHMEDLGWPDVPVVVKPPVSSGMRGLRIVSETEDRKKTFYSEKPSGVHIRKEELKAILGESFPELIATEFLSGKEYSVDVLTANRTVVIPRSRDHIRTGITFNGTAEKNQPIIEASEKLSMEMGLEYAHGYQFKLDEKGVPKILESNPRIQGTMVLSTLAGANVIYGAVKHALGEEVPKFDVKWGTRLMRYWGGISLVGKGLPQELI